MAQEKHKMMYGFKKMSAGLLMGLAAGAVVGLLTAPKKGKDLQKEIEKKFKELMDKLENGTDDLELKLKRIFGVVTKEFTEAYGRVHGEVAATITANKKDLKPGEYEKVVDKVVKKYQKKFKLAADSADKLKEDLIKSFKE